jgi:MSHA pilin protein MshD
MCVKNKQYGVTLIELIIFIIIVSVAIVGVLGVMDLVVKSSAEPMLRKQSVAMAEVIMEEVLSKNYTDDGVRETTRIAMDDVLDYNDFNYNALSNPTGNRILGSQLLNGSTTALPDTYWATVNVANTTVSGKTMALVTVSVTNPQNEVFILTGYRGNY